jgi:hypothetical protein
MGINEDQAMGKAKTVFEVCCSEGFCHLHLYRGKNTKGSRRVGSFTLEKERDSDVCTLVAVGMGRL